MTDISPQLTQTIFTAQATLKSSLSIIITALLVIRTEIGILYVQ